MVYRAWLLIFLVALAAVPILGWINGEINLPLVRRVCIITLLAYYLIGWMIRNILFAPLRYLIDNVRSFAQRWL